jgi:ABC-type Zn2+ transport system substrate-binding protein/surface adhesin
LLRPIRSCAAAAAVAALLLAQAFGLVHRIEHEVGHRSAGLELALAHAAALDAEAHEGDVCDSGDHGHAHDHDHDHDHDSAFSATHEEGSATCRLIDQAAHADAAPAASLPASLPAAATSVPAPKGVQAVVKAGAQPYRARGPPSNLA